jgi:hypothetical protein
MIDEPGSANDRTEWRNLLRHVDNTFGLLPSYRHVKTEHRPDSLLTRTGMHVRLLVAPSIRGRRPTTSQQLLYLGRRIPRANRRSILLVTSAIYAPYQFFVGAPPVLAEGTDHAELIGTPTGMYGDMRRIAQRIGQEVHAAIDAASRQVTSSQSSQGDEPT